MPNLIEQLNQIKGLSDEALAAEMSQPSGVTPPYLVMTELNRRKDMRQRYEGELARKQKSTTVVEDLMSAGAPSAGMPPMASMGGPPAMGGSGLPAAFGGGGGLAAALNQPNVPMGLPVPGASGDTVPGFKPGGLVDYESIANRYNDKLSNTGERQKRAQALALLSAGAAMMGGGSNTMANIGAGINAGVGSYSGQLEAIDNEEMETLRGLLDVQRLQYGADQDDRNYGLQREELDHRKAMDLTPKERDLPADVQKANWWLGASEEERNAYKETNTSPYNPLSADNAAWQRRVAVANAYKAHLEKARVEALAVAEDDMQGLGKQLISQDPAERAKAMEAVEAMAREKAVEGLATTHVGEEFAPYVEEYRQQLAAERGGGAQMTGAPADGAKRHSYIDYF